jgi:hypothetical protein
LFPTVHHHLKQEGKRLFSGTAFLTGMQHVGKVRAMLRLVVIIFIATLLGCGRGGAVQSGAALPQIDGQWFCEMAENTEDWTCVQDPELARSPVPSRLPKPKSSGVPVAVAAADALNGPQPAPIAAAQLPEAPPPPPLENAVAAQDAVAPQNAVAPEREAAPQPDMPQETDQAPEIAVLETDVAPRTAATPGSFLNMPAEFYAVQLMAMPSRERLEAYIREHNLTDMSATRIARAGELYYVLILGVYETRELAETASRDVPPPLDEREPWIRSLGNLQDAMIRANALAGDTPL